MIGHIKLERKILSWEWYQDVNVCRLFIHLLIIANHKDGKWQGNSVKRGQAIVGLHKLSASTGLSEMQIRTCFSKLKLTKEITIKSTNKFSVVTICNYDTYQSSKNADNKQNNEQDNIPATNEQQTDNKRITTNNNDNNKKNDNNEKEDNKGKPDFSFLKFYHFSYQDYKSLFNGQSTSEKMFVEWKAFIDFIYDKKYEEIFQCKFISPHDFAKLVKDEKYTQDKWEKSLKDLLASGIKKEHNLFFRIPKFLEYAKRSNKNTTGNSGSEATSDNLFDK